MIERLLEIAKIRSEMIDGIQRLPERGRWCLLVWAEIDLRARPLTLGSFSSSGPLVQTRVPCTRRRYIHRATEENSRGNKIPAASPKQNLFSARVRVGQIKRIGTTHRHRLRRS